MMNKFFEATIAGCIGIGLSALFLETYSYLLPVSDYIPYQRPITCSTGIPEITCFRRRSKSGFYSKGGVIPAEVQGRKKINDLYQFSDIDFEQLKNTQSHKIISVGDSYVEALQVDNDQTFHHKLNQQKHHMTGKNYISTAFGASGMSFPNYLKYIEFIQRYIQPNDYILVIPVIENDFNDAFAKSGSDSRGSFYFTETKDFSFVPLKENYSITASVLNFSRIARLLLLNMEIQNIPKRLDLSRELKSRKDIDNTSADGYKAALIFIEKLNKLRPSLLSRSQTIFVLDSDRPYIYDKGGQQNKYFENMRENFKNLAKSNGYSLIDTQQSFVSFFMANKRGVEFSIDPHWNKDGHKLVYDLISNKIRSF